jgi:DNA-binding transcriptional MerR regulator
MATVELPNRSLFKAPEVCEIAQLQPYVLRSWEAEFPDLGVTRAGSPGRVYRRHDVERVLRLKHLLFVEGLTLAGARRRLEEENTPLPPLDEAEMSGAGHTRGGKATKADGVLRQHLEQVQKGLRGLLDMLEHGKGADRGFRLHAPEVAAPETKAQKPPARSAPSKQAKHRK